MQIIYRVLFIIFLIFTNVHATSECHGNFTQAIKTLKNSSKSFFLSKLTFQADIPFSNDEFLHLTDLKIGQNYTPADVRRACKFLCNKKRFSTIDIKVEEYKNGKHLHFELKAHWVFKKLNFYGVLFGKQKYIALYAQQPGDIFDIQLHEESIKTLKQTLNDEGYFHHTINDQLIYSKKYKTIKTSIKVRRNKNFTISDINFDIKDLDQHEQATENYGIKRLPHSLRRKFRKPLVSRNYSKNRIINHIEKLRTYLKKKHFLNCRIAFTRTIDTELSTVTLTIHITLGKRKILTISGNEFFSDQEIKEEIIGSDEPDWLFAPDIITEQIMHAYYKKGYWETKVNYRALDHAGYHFNLEEGQPTLIEDIHIKEGAEHILQNPITFWPELMRNQQFDQEDLDLGIERLKSFYFAQGFWDFSIIGTRFLKNTESGNYNIRILVSQGIQRFWGGFEIENFKHLENSEFFKKYYLQASSQQIPFNYNWLAEQRLYLMNYFQNKGYWYVDVQPTFQSSSLDQKQMKIFLQWKVNLGQRVRFGKIVLHGDTRLPFKRIMHEIKFKEGQLWKREKLDLTRRKLKRLDIFKSVYITPTQLAKQTSKKPINLSLIDDDPAEIRLRLGYFLTSKNFLFRRESTPKIGASLVVKNPTNHADKLSLDFDWTRFEQKFDADYQQPSFFGLPFTGKFKGYANKYVHPVRIGSSSSAYEAIQNGFLMGINDEYKKDYFWGINVGNEWMRTSRVRGFLNLSPSLIDTTLPFFFVEPSLLIDKLDNRIDPHKGTLTFIALKTMIPENRGSLFARFVFEQSFFHPLWKNKFILASRIRIGHIFRRSFDQIMPIERFYLGGPYSVRGYEKDALPPIGVTEKDTAGNVVNEFTIKSDDELPYNPNVTREFTIQGGSTMVNGNLEIRFPLIKSLGGVLFQDIGVLSQTGFLGLNDTWFPASGFGLRYKTPIGAIRFDIGWKWRRRLPGDVSYSWYLTVGEAF